MSKEIAEITTAEMTTSTTEQSITLLPASVCLSIESVVYSDIRDIIDMNSLVNLTINSVLLELASKWYDIIERSINKLINYRIDVKYIVYVVDYYPISIFNSYIRVQIKHFVELKFISNLLKEEEIYLSKNLAEFLGIIKATRSYILNNIYNYINFNHLLYNNIIKCDNKLKVIFFNLKNIEVADIYSLIELNIIGTNIPPSIDKYNKDTRKCIFNSYKNLKKRKFPLSDRFTNGIDLELKELQKELSSDDESNHKRPKLKHPKNKLLPLLTIDRRNRLYIPVILSKALRSFIRTPLLAKPYIYMFIWNYANDNNLQYYREKLTVQCDEALKNLFKCDSFTSEELVQLIGKQVTYLKDADVKKAWRCQDKYLENNPIYDPRTREPTVRPPLVFEEVHTEEPKSFLVKTMEVEDKLYDYDTETDSDTDNDKII